MYVHCDRMPTIDMINDQYRRSRVLYIEKDKIGISAIDIINGGRIELIFRKVLSNGDIMLYEQSPRTFNQSFKKLEKDDRKTFGKKRKFRV